jgi:hypothetical protein
LDGSFYDFIVERFDGTRRQTLNCLRENWGGRGAVFWARQLAKDGAFEPEVEQVREVALVLDAIYHSA